MVVVEAKVTHELKAVVKSADSAKELIDDTSNNKQSAVTLLQDVVKDVRSAQDVVFQEAAANRAETQKEAFMRMQALQQGQMQLGQPQLNAAYQMQQMQNAKAMNAAQQQLQLAQMMQQFPQVPPAQNSYMQSLPEAYNMYEANGAFQHGQPRFP